MLDELSEKMNLVDHQTGTRKGRQGGVYCIQTAINVTIEGHKP